MHGGNARCLVGGQWRDYLRHPGGSRRAPAAVKGQPGAAGRIGVSVTTDSGHAWGHARRGEGVASEWSAVVPIRTPCP